MGKKTVSLDKATGAEMRAFASSHLGMDFKFNDANEKVRAAIRQAWNKDEIVVDEPDEPSAQTGTPPGPAQAAKEGDAEKVRVIIHITEESGGEESVPLGVNGRVMLVPRGKEEDLPPAYFEVLKNAVRHVFDALPDGGMSSVPRKVQAYPFQRLS